ncbi:MAG TPA: hypothetical protein EYP29_01550 [Thermoplasmata archaeon]|nr:hypothetical protein [Thermoplasmata archaeon]
MREYPIKRNHFKNIEGEKFKELVREHFNNFTEREDGTIETSFGALTRICLSLKGKTKLLVETEKKEGATEEEMLRTRKVYNQFLYKCTGFTAKERAKKLKESVKPKY